MRKHIHSIYIAHQIQYNYNVLPGPTWGRRPTTLLIRHKKCNGRCTICGQRWVKPCKHPHPVVMNTPTHQNFQNMKKNCRNLHFSVARGTGGGWPNQKMAIFFVLYIFSAIRVGWGRLYARIWGAWWCYCDLSSYFIPGEKIWGILEHFLKKRYFRIIYRCTIPVFST